MLLRPEQLEVRTLEQSDRDERAAAARCGAGGAVPLLRTRRRAAHPPGLNRGLGAGHEHTELLLARVHGEQALAVGTPVTVAAHGPATALG